LSIIYLVKRTATNVFESKTLHSDKQDENMSMYFANEAKKRSKKARGEAGGTEEYFPHTPIRLFVSLGIGLLGLGYRAWGLGLRAGRNGRQA
jgi:hypothetical protein